MNMKSHVYLSTWGIRFGYLRSLRRISTSGPLGGRWTRLRNVGWELPAATVSQHPLYGGLWKRWKRDGYFFIPFLNFGRVFSIINLWIFTGFQRLRTIGRFGSSEYASHSEKTWTLGEYFWLDELYNTMQQRPQQMTSFLLRAPESAQTNQFFTILNQVLGAKLRLNKG